MMIGEQRREGDARWMLKAMQMKERHALSEDSPEVPGERHELSVSLSEDMLRVNDNSCL